MSHFSFAGQSLRAVSLTAAAGGVSEVALSFGSPISVSATPGDGGTALVEYTLSAPAMVAAGSAVWHPWPLGGVSAFAQDVLVAPVVALRLSATAAPAIAELVAG
jgi:hypothetical protein